jgi:hypothetical protein
MYGIQVGRIDKLKFYDKLYLSLNAKMFHFVINVSCHGLFVLIIVQQLAS